MALAPGEVRKDLSADSLFRVLRSQFGSLPDPRSAEVEIPLGDALMSAFAMFSLSDEATASGRATRRASSDPACLPGSAPRSGIGGHETTGGSGRRRADGFPAW